MKFYGHGSRGGISKTDEETAKVILRPHNRMIYVTADCYDENEITGGGRDYYRIETIDKFCMGLQYTVQKHETLLAAFKDVDQAIHYISLLIGE